MILRERRAIVYAGLSVVMLFFVMNRQNLALYGYSNGPVKQVLILTYMRSGSSLTGDILQHSQGAFYVYEPLRALCQSNNCSGMLKHLLYANGSKSSTDLSFKKASYSILHDWFSCDIVKLPTVGLLDVFLDKGSKTKSFLSCFEQATLKTMNHSYAMEECARRLGDICEQSPIRIIKTIRSKLRHVKYLLDDYPNLKVIHVVRDPRATLLSQHHFRMCLARNGGRKRCTNDLCRRLEDDIFESDHLSKTYSNRIMTIKYEDLAKQPILTSQKMYDFIGVPMTSETKMYVYNKTMAGNDNDCGICTTRSNASAHIDSWKQQIDPHFLDIINKSSTDLSFKKASYSILHDWFSCDIVKLPTVGLLDVFLDKGSKTKSFLSCFEQATLKTMNHSYAMEECARRLGDICEQSPIRIIKTIRSKLRHVKYLLDDYPNLKVIHVVRDPRATLLSQHHFRMCLARNGGRKRCTNDLCRRLEDDIFESDHLSKTYSNRIMTIKYEDLAKQPILTSQKMYDFIGVPMTSETKMYVYNKTMAGNDNDCGICTTRSNASAHIDSWKQQIDPHFLDIINKRCQYVLKRFQYDIYTVK